jgi:hypothetical protein
MWDDMLLRCTSRLHLFWAWLGGRAIAFWWLASGGWRHLLLVLFGSISASFPDIRHTTNAFSHLLRRTHRVGGCVLRRSCPERAETSPPSHHLRWPFPAYILIHCLTHLSLASRGRSNQSTVCVCARQTPRDSMTDYLVRLSAPSRATRLTS